MVSQRSRRMGRTLTVLDCLLLILAYVVAFNINREIGGNGEFATLSQHLGFLPMVIVIFIAGMKYAGGYQRFKISSISLTWSVFSSVVLAMGVTLTATFMAEVDFYSRSFAYIFIGITTLIVVVVRLFLSWFSFNLIGSESSFYHRVLIVGSGARAKEAERLLRSFSEWDIDVVGLVDDRPPSDSEHRYLGSVNDIENILKNNVVDEVIIALPRTMLGELGPVFQACDIEGVRLKLMSDLFDFNAERIELDVLGKKPILIFEPVAHDELAILAKQVFDFMVTLISMPIVLPIMGLVALAIKLDSEGPVFFIQERVGLRKRTFPMIKFRSMYTDAEERLKEIEHLNEADGPIFKIKDDPRVTRVGKWIRKLSLDELPQLFNVLMGHMSLVGPRPMSMRDVSLFDQSIQRRRFTVRPGLTCLWQVSGRSDLPFEQWLELDLHYIHHWSFALDIKILLKTVPTVLFAKGAS